MINKFISIVKLRCSYFAGRAATQTCICASHDLCKGQQMGVPSLNDLAVDGT